MLAISLPRGLCFFWSPNFDKRYERETPIPESLLRRVEQKRKEFSCSTEQALQKSLIEARKIGVGEGALKKLIKAHKASCATCRASEK